MEWGEVTARQINGEAAERLEVPRNGTTPNQFRCTDEGNAERIVYAFGTRMRHCFERNEWLLWSGRHWQPDYTRNIENMAVACARSILREAADVEDKAFRETLTRNSKYLESKRGMSNALDLARKHVAIAADDLDRDPFLINCQNGTFDVRTGGIRSHSKDDFISCITRFAYDPDAYSDRLNGFLLDVTNADGELLEFLQRAGGYSFTGSTAEKAVFLVIGPPDTGKSTFFEAMAAAAGSYARKADFESFIARREVGEARQDIARLAGSRLVMAAETDQGRKLAEGLVRKLSGQEKIVARFLYGREFEFEPRFKVWLGCNDAPKIRHADQALWNRVRRVPFLTRPEEKDYGLGDHLRDADGAGPAFLRWILDGAAKWYQQRLGTAQACEDAKTEYREEMDPFSEFFSDRLEFAADYEETSENLWTSYGNWAQRVGPPVKGNRKELAAALEARGCVQDRLGTAQVRGWKGVKVAEEKDPRDWWQTQ